MAKQDRTAPAELLRKECVVGEIFTGTPEQLIAAGLVRPEHLPGQPGVGKATVTVYDGKFVPCRSPRPPRDEKYRHISRTNSQRYEVWVYATEEEQKRRRIASDLREAEDRAAEEFKSVPKTHEQYRSQVAKELSGLIGWFRQKRMGENKEHGFSFDDETLCEFDEVVGDLLATVENGCSVYSAARQKARFAGIESNVAVAEAKADSSLQEFLTGVLTKTSEQPARHTNLRGQQ